MPSRWLGVNYKPHLSGRIYDFPNTVPSSVIAQEPAREFLKYSTLHHFSGQLQIQLRTINHEQQLSCYLTRFYDFCIKLNRSGTSPFRPTNRLPAQAELVSLLLRALLALIIFTLV